METEMDVSTADDWAPWLLRMPDETVVKMLAFLDFKSIGRLGLTNSIFYDSSHIIWYSLALALRNGNVGGSYDGSYDDCHVNWKNAVAVSLHHRMPKLEFKNVLNNHIHAMVGAYTHASTHISSEINSWKPQLYIPAAGMQMSLPLDSAQLRELIDGGYCQQAPVGRGPETLVDLETRKGKRLMICSDVLVGDSEGNAFPSCTGLLMDDILHQIQAEMVPHLFAGGGKVWAQPYSMLIYEKGDFFKPHRDTLRGKHHFGSLVVMLPVQGGCEGGEFILTHGSSSSGDDEVQQVESVTPPGEVDDVRFLAFFTDMFHHVQPVNAGFRVSLTFHLWAVPPPSGLAMTVTPKVSPNAAQMLQVLLKDGLERHFSYYGEDSHRFVLPLDHKYGARATDIGQLRGRDRLVHQLLKDALTSSQMAQPKLDMEVSLEQIAVEAFEKPKDPLEYHPLWLVVVDENKKNTDRASDQTVWLNQERFLTMQHTFSEYQYYTGNDGYENGFEYVHACSVIRALGFELDLE